MHELNILDQKNRPEKSDQAIGPEPELQVTTMLLKNVNKYTL